jgi:transcriptional regulator with XRE-family HTH domain
MSGEIDTKGRLDRPAFSRFSEVQRALTAELRQAMDFVRYRRNLRQCDIAEAMGSNQPTVSRLFHGKANPTLRTLTLLLAAMGMRGTLTIVPARDGEDAPPITVRFIDDDG